MTANDKPLRITDAEGDVVEIRLTGEKTPVAYLRKKHELTRFSGMTEREAEQYLWTPIPMELFYDIGKGLFGVESEAAESCEIYNPYTGKEVPNSNLPEKEEKSLQDRLGEIICRMKDFRSELREIWESAGFSPEDEERIKDAINNIDDALSECIAWTNHVRQIKSPQ